MQKMPTALVTSGPTIEKIDPVRFISNFSSGKQGYAIASALLDAGFEVTLISGPVNISPPLGVRLIKVITAEEMLAASLAALPVDVAVCAAAVCDFRPEKTVTQKIKKQSGTNATILELIQNPDILQTIGNHRLRPKIVVGFAAETENLIENATKKLHSKNCDIIIANDVSEGKVFGSDSTTVSIISRQKVEHLGQLDKNTAASELVAIIAKLL